LADIVPFPTKPEDRLRSALRRLDDALTEQKLAFTEFRTNLAALGGAVSGLDQSMQTYRATLAETAQELATSHVAARQLEAAADIWLNQAR